MREYHEVFDQELPPLPKEPVLSDFYTPTDEQHYRELGFIALSMIGIAGVLYYLERYIMLLTVIYLFSSNHIGIDQSSDAYNQSP